VLNEWVDELATALGVDVDVDINDLLDLARDAAHGVARPAAPLTTFLVGYAAAQAGGGPDAIRSASATARSLLGSAAPSVGDREHHEAGADDRR
jgi:Domain of unknown function (DUF6457)